MSWNLTQPNQLSLYSREFNAKTLLADSLSALTLVSDRVVSNDLKTTAGSNYLGVWSATKLYKTNDIVLFNNLLYRCLVNDTILTAPNPADPAQAEWVQLSSNNAIKSDPLYIQVSKVNGNDAKALVAPVPFFTIQAALNFASPGAVIHLIDRNSVWDEALTVNKSDITIDGGLDGLQQIGVGNVIQSTSTPVGGDQIFVTAGNFTLKNVILKRVASTRAVTMTSTGTEKNYTFDNCIFEQPNSSSPGVLLNVTNGWDWGDITFNNCRNAVSAFPTLNYLNFLIQLSSTTGTQVKSRLNVNNFRGLFVHGAISFATYPTCANFYDVNVSNANAFELADGANVSGNILIKDSILATRGAAWGNSATNSQPGNRLTIINSSLYNRDTQTYTVLTKTGNAPYQFIDLDYDRNLTGSLVNGTGSIITAGPARWYNMIGQTASGAAASSLVTNTVTQLQFGNITIETPIDFLNIANPNELTILWIGVYRIIINLEAQASQTAAQCQSVAIWVGPVGSTEGTATYLQSYVTPFVSNATTFPTQRFSLEFYVSQNAVNQVYSFYARNTSATTFTSRILGMVVQCIR